MTINFVTMKKVLAIDYGTKRLGLAVNRAGLAEPLMIIESTHQLWIQLIKVVDTEEIELILVGISENEMAKKTQIFVQELKEQLQLPVELIDETLSSQVVHHWLASSPMRLKKRQGPIDHYAAAVMLQEWLETNSLISEAV